MIGWDSALFLENGHLFEGRGFGAQGPGSGEAVFNTGMTGYQEIFTDPSYCSQVVVMTYPHLGNTGVNWEDVESGRLYLSGVVAREYVAEPSNWRSTQPLHTYLEKVGVPGISEIDTRKVTRILRDEGAQRAVIFNAEGGDLRAKGRQLLEKVAPMEGLELVSQVSCVEAYEFLGDDKPLAPASFKTDGTVVVFDYGAKRNILRELLKFGFKVQVVPYNTTAEEVMGYDPVAVVLSNGPGDPGGVKIAELETLVGRVPIFAVCMGHQVLARALGATTYKLKFGHHGCNHPVKDLDDGRILITSQNHGFSVERRSLNRDDIKVSHVSLNDDTVEGFYSEKLRLMSFQFHPESKPGPQDSAYLFEKFIKGFLK